jgi:hypothetical protein
MDEYRISFEKNIVYISKVYLEQKITKKKKKEIKANLTPFTWPVPTT